MRSSLPVMLGLCACLAHASCSSDPTSGPDRGITLDGSSGDIGRVGDGIAGRDGPSPEAAVDDGRAGDGRPADLNPRSDSGAPGSAAANCVKRSQAIRARAGKTIQVSPGAKGKVLVGGKSTTLRQVVSSAKSGETIVLADGTYTFAESSGGSYTGLYFTKSKVTMRSKSGNRAAVILDSNYADHGNSSALITVNAPGVVLADFTVKRSIFHLIHLWANGDQATLHNIRYVDGGQQFLKASPGAGKSVDDVEVTCSEFVMTKAGRDNVWGYGSSSGNTTCYTGGIDTHDARNWRVADSRFIGIYCDASGVKRPAHGKMGSVRNNQTYQGGLAEYAIHMWDSPQGSAHTIERNQIINCARGIGLGMKTDVYGTMIRNNFVFSTHAASREHDVGINLDRGHDVSALNNTVFLSSASAYRNAIEYRRSVSSGLKIRNNLTNRAISSRDGAKATLSNNLTKAQAAWFKKAAAGDLHLAACNNAAIDSKGMTLAMVPSDIDGDSRSKGNDIGADQCTK